MRVCIYLVLRPLVFTILREDFLVRCRRLRLPPTNERLRLPPTNEVVSVAAMELPPIRRLPPPSMFPSPDIANFLKASTVRGPLYTT